MNPMHLSNNNDQSRVRPSVQARAMVMALSATLGLGLGSAALSEPNASPPPSASRSASSEAPSRPGQNFQINAGQAAELAFEQAQLNLPSDALATNQMIRIERLEVNDLARLNAGMTNVTGGVGAGFRFSPAGQQFAVPVEVRLPYDPAKLPATKTEDDIRSYYYNVAAKRWLPLKRLAVDKQNQVIVSETTHFTDMINGTVTTPEYGSPQSFNPNSLKGIQAATPAANINLIQPPSANQMGDARLSYPIEVPPGRLGMQPQLAISYSSAASNGWLGLGWDLSTPSITVDTRWGVPRYDDQKETDTYLLDGQMLIPVDDNNNDVSLPHRTPADSQAARVDGQAFRLRVEGRFAKIIRHGNSPDTYWWEVVDKDGTRRFYGGTPENNQRATSVLADPSDGDVFRWALREVRDTNGNNVLYDCVLIDDTGVQGGSVTGQQLYPQSIHYSGNINTGIAPAYRVDLIRDRDLPGYDSATDCADANNTRRCDVSISGREGFKVVTADRLARINIVYTGTGSDELARQYRLEYRDGPYSKSLLKAIHQHGADESLFHSHRFDYHHEDGSRIGFAAAEDWITHDDAIDLGPADPAGFAKATAIGGGKGTSSGGHIYVGISGSEGKASSVGATLEFSQSQTEDELTFIDINGDNLPDKIYRKADGTKYRLNQSGPAGTGETTYGPERNISGLGRLSSDSTLSLNIGASAHGDDGSVYTTNGFSISVNPDYIQDVNGDGLPDLIAGRSASFNHLDGDDPNYSPASDGTPYPIAAGMLDHEDLVDFSEQRDQQIDEFPLIDSLRRWVAPFDGTVRITGPVRLEQNLPNSANYDDADGVRVAIQHNGNELWSQTIDANDGGIKNPAGVAAVSVTAGDRLYFRVGSRFDGAFDQVSWNPEIVYNGQSAQTDVNGLNIWRYSASEDFTLAGRRASINAPLKGTVEITGTVTKSAATTDDVVIEIARQGQIIFTQTMAADSTSAVNVNVTQNVNHNDVLQARLLSDSPIDATVLAWQPRIRYTSIDNNPGGEVSNDENGNPPTVEQAIPYWLNAYSLRENRPQETWQPSQVNVSGPLIAELAFDDTVSGEIIWTVKQPGQRIAKRTLTINNGQIVGSNELNASVQRFQKYFIDFSTRDHELASALTQVKVWHDANNNHTRDAGEIFLPSQQIGIHEPDLDFSGQARYRGWTMLGYNGNRDRATQPIDESEFVTPTQPADDAGASLLPKNSDYFIYFPNTDTSPIQWTGPKATTWVEPVAMRSSRFGPDRPTAPQNSDFAGGTGVPRIGMGTQFSTGAGQGGQSAGVNQGVLDFIDMNGDRFPDVVSSGRIQYSDSVGGLGGTTGGGTTVRQNTSITHAVSMAANAAIAIPSGAGYVDAAPAGGGNDVMTCTASYGQHRGFKPSLGFSGNVGFGESDADKELLDLNGDGLPDQVDDGLDVNWNIGYGFTGGESFGSAKLNEGFSANGGAGASYNNGNYGIGGGVSVGTAYSIAEESLADLNADGLPDRIKGLGSDMTVAFNTGAGFTAEQDWPGADDATSAKRNINVGGGVYFTISIQIYQIYLIINPGVNAGAAAHRPEITLRDIDGDGDVDQLDSDRDGNITVRRNLTDTTNLLKTIHRPLGATIALDYARSGNTFEQPQNRWILSDVVVNDGHAGDGADTMRNRYSYADGFHSRWEREFYGFAQVKVEELDTDNADALYRNSQTDYHNRDYYLKGLPIRSILSDANGNPYTETQPSYRLIQVSDQSELAPHQKNLPSDQASERQTRIFVQSVQQDSYWYEGQAQPGQATRMIFAYDALGNVTDYCDFGSVALDTSQTGPARINTDPGNPANSAQDDLCASISYHTDPGPYIVGLADSIQVFGDQDSPAGNHRQLLRERQAEFELGSGNLLAVHACRLVDETNRCDPATFPDDAQTTAISYDPDGLTKTVTEPTGYTLTYSYEPITRSHVQQIDDSFGEQAQTQFTPASLKYGLPSAQLDLNNQTISYSYDAFARTETVTGPYEQGTGQPSIRFAYGHAAHPHDGGSADGVAFAVTQHIDINCPADLVTDKFDETKRLACLQDYRTDASAALDTIDTITFVDGLTRPIQLKKDAAIRGSVGRTVSGRMLFDAFGRTVASHYPLVDEQAATVLDARFNSIRPTRMDYDVLDRAIKTTLPDLSHSQTTYGFGLDRQGHDRFATTVRDANGVEQSSFTDVRGRITSLYQLDRISHQQIWTQYRYNAINELLLVTDTLGNPTESEYDRLGRRIVLSNPDTGRTAYAYDPQGRFTTQTQPDGALISWLYDQNRLTGIDYPAPPTDPQDPLNNPPLYPELDVSFTYGSRGDGANGAGRVIQTTHQSGQSEQQYGRMGETITETVTLNRVAPVDPAAQNPVIVDRSDVFTIHTISDQWGRQRKRQYPNHPGRAFTPLPPAPQVPIEGEEQAGQTVTWQYDAGGLLNNITGQRIVNLAATAQLSYLNDLQYDEYSSRSQIQHGRGDTANGVVADYQYDPQRRWLKQLTASFTGLPQVEDDRVLQDLRYLYDPVGNIRSIRNQMPSRDGQADQQDHSTRGVTVQTYDYDELYRLRRATGQYQYLDAAGETNTDRYTLALDYDSIHNITSKTRSHTPAAGGTALSHDLQYHYSSVRPHAPTKIGEISYAYDAKGNRRLWNNNVAAEWDDANQLQHYYAAATVDPMAPDDPPASAPTAKYRYDASGTRAIKQDIGEVTETLYVAADYIVTVGEQETENTLDRIRSTYIHANQQKLMVRMDVTSQRCGGLNTETEPETLIWYHSDHLGSTNYLTDHCGEVLEHTEYFPFGEPWFAYETLNQFAGSPEQDFEYTGKELDQETGFYYYGARYYDPTNAVWLNPDPILHSYMDFQPSFGVLEPKNLNLYGYSWNNPVRYLDPDGNVTIEAAWNVFKGFGNVGVDVYNTAVLTATLETQARAGGNTLATVQHSLPDGHTSPLESAVESAPLLPRFSYEGDIEDKSIGYGIEVGGVVLSGGRTLLGKSAARIQIKKSATEKGLGGNPFQGKTPKQIDKMFRKKGFDDKGTDPAAGKGSYINPKTGRKYYIDKGGVYKKGTELPHVDVHRPSSSSLPKKKLPLGDRLIK